jgi:ABC-2 type transport system ATP-binding protein
VEFCPPEEGRMPQLLSLRDVTIGRGPRVVVRNLSLNVEAGEVFGLLGPNGCGKSTTLSAIMGLLPFRGEIRIAGRTLASDSRAYRRLVGIVPQDLALYEELTVTQNLDFFARLYGLNRVERRRRLGEVLDFVQLADRAGGVARTLSGGMQRRLNLACALLHEPRVLLLDEPTVGLDVPARDAIFASLRRLAAEGRALVFTTHHLQEAASLCNRLGVMDEGQLVAAGSLDELHAALPGTSPEDSRRRRLDGPHALREAGAGVRLERVFLGLTRSGQAEGVA